MKAWALLCALGVLICLPGMSGADDSALISLNELLSQRDFAKEDIIKKEIGQKEVFRPDLRCYETQMIFEIWLKERVIPEQQLIYSSGRDAGKPVYVAERKHSRWVNRPVMVQSEDDFLVRGTTFIKKETSEGFEYMTRDAK